MLLHWNCLHVHQPYCYKGLFNKLQWDKKFFFTNNWIPPKFSGKNLALPQFL